MVPMGVVATALVEKLTRETESGKGFHKLYLNHPLFFRAWHALLVLIRTVLFIFSSQEVT